MENTHLYTHARGVVPMTQVYAHYRPALRRTVTTGGGGEASGTSREVAEGSSGSAVSVGGAGISSTNFECDSPAGPGATAVCERLSITCRLVKDFQQEILLIARCTRVFVLPTFCVVP